MVIIKIELGHYYFAHKNTFSLFLSSIETQKKGNEGKLHVCMKHVYVLFHNIMLFLHFYNLSAQFSFSFECLHTNARERLEEHEMLSEHKPETSVLTTFF